MSNDDEIARLEARLAELKAEKAAAPIEPPVEPAPPIPPRLIPPKNDGGSIFLIIAGAIVGLLVLIWIIGSLSPRPSAPSLGTTDGGARSPEEAAALAAGNAAGYTATDPANATNSAPATPAEPMPPPSAWRYTTDLDPMTDRPTHFACVTSTNTISLGFPYGVRSGRLCVRQSPQHGRDVYVSLDGSGQILCRSYDGCTIGVRFDDGQQQRFSATGPSDGSTETVFITNEGRAIEALKSADTTRVQLEFYQNGNQVFTFNTTGLEWPRPAEAAQ